MSDQEKQELPDGQAENLETDASTSPEGEPAVDLVEPEADVGSDSDLDVEAELEQAQLEIAKLKDAFLRAKAEEDNIRRRAEKEVASSRKFAVEGFAKEMVNVYDSLKLAMAVEVAEDADDAVKGIHDGVGITLKQLQSAFSKFSLVEIAPEVGTKLDPNLHQAMTMVESDEVESGGIINVIQAGFQLHDRLIRPAMVVVAK